MGIALNSLVLFRAWLTVHRAFPAWIAVVVFATTATAFARASVPSWGVGTQVPLWGLVPGTVAMLLATTAQNQLAMPWALSRAPRFARTCWAAVTVGLGIAACVPVSRVIEQPGILAPTGALVGVSLAAALAVRGASLLPGALTDLVVAGNGGRLDPDQLFASTSTLISAMTLTDVAVIVALVALYGFIGAREPRTVDEPY